MVEVTEVLSPWPGSWSVQACEAWQQRFGGTAPGGQIGAHLKRLQREHPDWTEVLAAWQRYLGETEAQFASAARFVTTFGAWNGTAAPARRKTVNDRTRENLERWLEGQERKRTAEGEAQR